jgi:hypothetical protein
MQHVVTDRGGAVLSRVPDSTLEWLLAEDNPAVAVLTRRTLQGEDPSASEQLWMRRGGYEPVARILDAQSPDGSWEVPARDYKKYQGTLWQIHFLGELWADGSDERVKRSAEYAFSRQLAEGSWSVSNMRASGSITCLTANVGRALARLGWASDERVVHALDYCARLSRELGTIGCRPLDGYQLNGYCHMVTPKLLLFLAEVPRALWPHGAEELRDACVAALRDKQVFRYLPAEAREFQEALSHVRPAEWHELREGFLAEHEPLHYGDKPGWLRFGYPLSYNSDALEAMWALARSGEARRPEYEAALGAIESAADVQMRWTTRNTLNGKMLADVEKKGSPSRWLTLRALQVLDHFAA